MWENSFKYLNKYDPMFEYVNINPFKGWQMVYSVNLAESEDGYVVDTDR